MNNKLVPALIGGAVIGVVCSIIGNIPIVSLCCCLVAISGGARAVMLYVKKSTTPVTIGEGAMLGAMAGGIGGAIYFVLTSLIMGLIIGAGAYEAQMRQLGGEAPVSGITLVIIGALVGAIILTVLSVGGGALGVAIFEKRKGGDTPPPPAGTYGDQGGGYAGGGYPQQ